jgi:hypothetical protein
MGRCVNVTVTGRQTMAHKINPPFSYDRSTNLEKEPTSQNNGVGVTKGI